MQAFGLRTHILNNNLRSAFLLAGFPFLLLLLAYGGALLFVGMSISNDVSPGAAFAMANDAFPGAASAALIGAGIWFVIAYFAHQTLIDLATGARGVSREEQPELYNLLENLAISRGLPMPSLRIIDTPIMNAYASGLSEKKAAVTVTRGLLDALNTQELEAVLAHELTHIRNRDVRTMVVASVFAGIISFTGELLWRWLANGGFGYRSSGGGGRSRRSDDNGGGGGQIAVILAALAIAFLAWLFSVVIRLALSRSREFVADAGAVELTKNPDAMISALRKIDGHSDIPTAPSSVQEMMLDDPPSGFGWLFATHPPISKRIEALVQFAGGRDDLPRPTTALAAPVEDAPLQQGMSPKLLGPWGARGGAQKQGPWGRRS